MACSCLPHSWRRLIAFSLLPTVGFCGHCLHAAGCLDSFSAVCWVGGLSDLTLSPSSLTFTILPLGSGRIQTVSVVCLPVLPCHMLGSSRRCPGCLLLASGACHSFCYLWLLSLGFLPSPSSLILSSIFL